MRVQARASREAPQIRAVRPDGVDLVVAIAILLLTFVPLSALHITLGDVAEFRQSGLPDLATYMAGENIAAATNHLWIAPVVGILFGSVGGLLGSAVSPRAARRSSG